VENNLKLISTILLSGLFTTSSKMQKKRYREGYNVHIKSIILTILCLIIFILTSSGTAITVFSSFKYFVLSSENNLANRSDSDPYGIVPVVEHKFYKLGMQIIAQNKEDWPSEAKEMPCLVGNVKVIQTIRGEVTIELQNCKAEIIYQNTGFSSGKISSVVAMKACVKAIKPLNYLIYEFLPNQLSYEKVAQLVLNENVKTSPKIYESKSEPTPSIPIQKPISAVQLSEVDINIPLTRVAKPNSYALIIGNEDYKSKQSGLSEEQNVDFALNDAKIFAEYCHKTIGIPKTQIKLLENATFVEMRRGVSWIKNLAEIENGNAELIFYYSGHGLPHEVTKEAYLIPVDVSGTDLDYAVKLSTVYAALTSYKAKSVTAFIDACFSGGSRNESLLSVKGVKIVPKENIIRNDLVVFSSSKGNESSHVYNEMSHGYFTYFLLKKLKETNGSVSYSELGNYINFSVRKQTGLIGKKQTPQVLVSPSADSKWGSWKLK